MTQIPIKLLKDKTQRPFIPYVPAEAITVNGTNYMLGDPEGLLELLKVVPQYNANKEQIFEQNNGILRWVDKTIIPTRTSQLTNDSNFPVDASYVHTDNNYTNTDKNKLAGIAAGAEVNVQSDWNETNTVSDSYIKNKPIVPTKISDLINDSTFEDTDNKTTNVSKNSTDTEYPSAKAVYDYVYNHAAPAYLGAITEFNTQAKALDITDLKPGLYLLYGDYYNAGENLYIKYKFNNNYVYGHKMFMQIHFVNHQLCLKINEIETPTVGDLLGSISYSEITDGGSSDANTIPIELNTNSISFNTGTNQGFTAVKTTDDQSIGGLKTFSIAPRSLAAPLVNTDLANKEYVDSVAGGGSNYVVLTYNGVDNAANRATVQTYYNNNRNGIPTVLLLVTDENTPMPTGANIHNSIIVPMSLDDSSATFPENSRACMIGMASTLDWGRPLYAKQIINMSGGTVNYLYNISWPTPTYMEFELWYQKSGLSAYNASSTYAVGDYVYNSGGMGLTIYKCNTAISTPEAWNTNHWTEKTYLEYLQDVIVNNALGGNY